VVTSSSPGRYAKSPCFPIENRTRRSQGPSSSKRSQIGGGLGGGTSDAAITMEASPEARDTAAALLDAVCVPVVGRLVRFPAAMCFPSVIEYGLVCSERGFIGVRDTSNSDGLQEHHRVSAYAALDLVQTSPSEAAEVAHGLVHDSDPETVAVAYWTLGRANYEQGNYDASERLLRSALTRARRAGLVDVACHIRLSLAAVCVDSGATKSALRWLRSVTTPSGILAGRVHQQRAFVYHQLGRDHLSVAESSLALPLLRECHDRLGEARVLINRAVALLALDDLDAAESDLVSCRVVAEELDQRFIVAAVDHNLACVAGRRGDMLVALERFEHAQDGYASLGEPGRAMPLLVIDIARTLLGAGLAAEALEYARHAIALAGADALQGAEASLVLARAARATGSYVEAMECARTASACFSLARREPWSIYCDFVAFDSQVAIEETAAGDMVTVRTLAQSLTAAGWVDEAAQVRLAACRFALNHALVGEARVELAAALPAARSLEARTAVDDLRARISFAERRYAHASRSVNRGLGVLERYQSSLGSELRTATARLAAPLVEVGLDIACHRSDPLLVLELSERARSFARPVSSAEDPDLQRSLVQYRRVAQESQGGAAAARTLRAAERNVLERSRRLGSDTAAGVLDVAALTSSLEERTLVSLTAHRGKLIAATVTDGQWSLTTTATVADVTAEVDYLRSAVRRLFATASPLAADRVNAAAQRLQALILDPLPIDPSRVEVVIPGGCARSIPWGLLPALRDVPFSVAPSVWAWKTSREASPPRNTFGAIVGPRLQWGDDEVSRLDIRDIRTGRHATAQAARDLFATADVVHVAAHGTHRADRPLFSGFALHDGPLTLFDLERMSKLPAILVLSSCETASATSADHALVGLAPSVVGRGVSSLIAPVDVIPDKDSVDLMVDLHAMLKAGISTAASVQKLRTNAPNNRSQIVASTFLAIGASVAVTART
jgi:tetratricopeptide (TPR) repeat protein